MIRTNNTRTLREFSEDSTAHLDRIAQSNVIEVLTVDGEPKGVVMSPQVFDAIIERIEELETTASIGRGLANVAAGRTRPARDFYDDLAKKYGLVLDLEPE